MYLRSGAGVVDSGRDEHAALAVDDDSPVVVAHVEWLEHVGRACLCYLNRHHQHRY